MIIASKPCFTLFMVAPYIYRANEPYESTVHGKAYFIYKTINDFHVLHYLSKNMFVLIHVTIRSMYSEINSKTSLFHRHLFYLFS